MAGRPAGRQLEPGFGSAEWGFAIGSPFWGRGIFVEGAKAVIDFSFGVVGMQRLEARSIASNGRGNAALRKSVRTRKARFAVRSSGTGVL